MKIEIFMQPVFELQLTYQDIESLLTLSDNHYGSRCRSAGQDGGFLYSWRDSTGWSAEDGASVPVSPTQVQATHRELDTLLKICEVSGLALKSKMISTEQYDNINRLCSLITSAIEAVKSRLGSAAHITVTEPTDAGSMLWGTSPGRM